MTALEHEWHRAEREDPDRALGAAVALADALVDTGKHRAAAGLLARATRGAAPDDPAAPHAGIRLGDLAFTIGHLEDAERGYELAIYGGVTTARSLARHGVFLSARGHQRQGLRHLTAALMDPAGPGEIATAARMLLHAAQNSRDELGPLWARGALEGFRIVRDDDHAAQAQQIVNGARELGHEPFGIQRRSESLGLGF
ncbi:MAG: hypothetical protein ACOYNI_07450 [Acidimicrobiia bacterium]